MNMWTLQIDCSAKLILKLFAMLCFPENVKKFPPFDTEMLQLRDFVFQFLYHSAKGKCTDVLLKGCFYNMCLRCIGMLHG